MARMKPKQERAAASALTFDDQAQDFDRRAGLPPEACRSVAEAVAGMADGLVGPLLDLGAGTGEIGLQLALQSRPYVALDLSVPMLASFRRKLGTGRPQVPGTDPQVPGTDFEASAGRLPQVPGTDFEVGAGRHPQVPGTDFAAGADRLPQVPGTWTPGLLVCTDADRGLPLAEDSVAVIFSSRAVHLLGLSQLVEEIERLRRATGALLVLGSVQRQQGSVRQAMRRQMRHLLADRGVVGRSGRAGRDHLREALAAKGWRREPASQVATWSVEERPRDSLNAWHRKTGLAGLTLNAELRRTVLDELEAWAKIRYGDLDARSSTTETYQLEAMRWLRSQEETAPR